MGRLHADVGGPRHPPWLVRLVLHVVPALRQAVPRDRDFGGEGNRAAADSSRGLARAAPCAGRASLMSGVLARFRELDLLCDAIEDLKAGKYREVTVYSPAPRHEIIAAVNAPRSG